MSFFWHNCLRIYTSVFTLSYFSSINLIWAFKISNWEFKEVSTWLDSWDGLPPCEISLWIGIILAFLHSLYSYEIVTWGFPSSFSPFFLTFSQATLTSACCLWLSPKAYWKLNPPNSSIFGTTCVHFSCLRATIEVYATHPLGPH